MSRDHPKFVLEGKITVYEQEGGYAAPGIEIGLDGATERLQASSEFVDFLCNRPELMPEKNEKRKCNAQDEWEPVGRWRVTFERIEP